MGINIKLPEIEDLNCFMKVCNIYEEDIDVKQKRAVIDGKSYLGLLSLDLSQPITVVIHTERTSVRDMFYKTLEKWKVEGEAQ